MTINPLEHVGKYYCLFVNKNHTKLKDFYDKNVNDYLSQNVSFPAYCYLEFMRSKIMEQPDGVSIGIAAIGIEDLIQKVPIK
jgi:hypothetical protein